MIRYRGRLVDLDFLTLDGLSMAPLVSGIVIGALVVIKGDGGDGNTPLVLCPGTVASGAVSARSLIHLRGGHIGSQVVLVFEAADPAKPIVVGVLRTSARCSLPEGLTMLRSMSTASK